MLRTSIKRIELWGFIASRWNFGAFFEIRQGPAFYLHLGRLWLGVRWAKSKPLNYVPNCVPGSTAQKED